MALNILYEDPSDLEEKSIFPFQLHPHKKRQFEKSIQDIYNDP